MRTSRAMGLVFLATAALAQQPQSVEITSEPSHHLVFQNEYVRVFDVTVAPRATTLIHRHNYDYLFVTLGDSDVVSTRVNEKPVALELKDGEVRFTPGHFAHAAVNNSNRPFHNITIELLKSSTDVKTCAQNCDSGGCIGSVPGTPGDDSKAATCPATLRLISADQWTASLVNMPSNATLSLPAKGSILLVAVTEFDLGRQSGDAVGPFKRQPGGFDWIPAGERTTVRNSTSQAARFVTLEFNPEKQAQ